MRQFRIVGVDLQNRQIMTGITVTVPNDIPLTIANGNNASGIEANPDAVAYVVTAVTTEMIRYAASECLKAYNQSQTETIVSQDLPHIEAIARAINPLVWSDNASKAHRAASPYSVDAARLMSMKDAFGLVQRLEVGGYKVVRIKVGVSRPIDITEN